MTPLPPISVSLNPTYYCNLRCEFCYLTKDQLSDRRLLSINTLIDRLEALQRVYRIQHVDLYGGEILMLPSAYLRELLDVIHNRGIESINVVTNLTTTHPAMNWTDFHLTVSYDSHARERHEEVLSRMQELKRPFSILILASPQLDAVDPLELQLELNTLTNLVSVEFKPYSESQANQWGPSYKRYERWVQTFIDSPLGRNYQLVNIQQIKDALAGVRNAYSDDHIYITPQGDYAVLEFDDQDREFFLTLDNVSDYQHWTRVEKERVNKNTYCQSCEYLGSCLTEHLREVRDMEQSCNGFKHLLDWAKTQPELKPIQVPAVKPHPNDPPWLHAMYRYHLSQTKHSDDLRRIDVLELVPNADHILEYLTKRFPRLIYPAKSIAVACVYALMIQRTYGDDPYDTVSHPNLFLGTDKYFKPYPAYRELYDYTFDYLQRIPNWEHNGWVPETIAYWRAECLFDN